MALAKENGVELTLEKAKEHLDKMANIDMALSDEDMKAAAGGGWIDTDACGGW